MPSAKPGTLLVAVMLLACCVSAACGQGPWPGSGGLPAPVNPKSVITTIVDENGVPVNDARVTIHQQGQSDHHLVTDYAGRVWWVPLGTAEYTIRVDKSGFYQTVENAVDPTEKSVRLILTHEQIVQQEVNVNASAPGLDPQQVSDQKALNLPEITNVPFPLDRDIRTLLPFTPQVIGDVTGQVHVAGGETYMTLDTLDGFDIRSPVFGTLDMRVSTDAVRSVDTETTRYPVEYGRATGGVIAFSTGMGDNRFRYNATDFIPSWREQKGLHFDKFQPRFTFSGPIKRDRAWFFDAIDTEYANNFVSGLPSNADTNHSLRLGNLLKFQVNLGQHNSVTTGLLANSYHSPYEGLSAITPQQSTNNHDITAWLPYIRDQQSFTNGLVADGGFALMRYRDGFEPHGNLPYELTPELPRGSNFSNNTTRSERKEGYANAYLPPRHLFGTHQLRAGVDFDQIEFTRNVTRAPVNYLREDGTLSRRSTFPSYIPFGRDNLESAIYGEDRWTPRSGLLIEPGLRVDWDEIIRQPLWSPRMAAVYVPPGRENTTKISAGIGQYYEHTQLEYLARALAGTRYDTFYAADGLTPLGPRVTTQFLYDPRSLKEAHALNWSVGLEQKIPANIYFTMNFMQKRLEDLFVYQNVNGSPYVGGTYLLTNSRRDHYDSVEFDARRTFSSGYTLFGSYTRSRARTNTDLDYLPTISLLGPQQTGPLPWDVPNRIVSWGWLPAWAPKLPSVKKNWDFVYTLQWNTGLPFDSVNANQQLVGAPGSRRYPHYVNFAPGLEWRFHFHGKYFGLRGVLDNATDAKNPYVVYNNVDSPLYGTFAQPQGRAFTTRIRLIEQSKSR